MTVKNCTNHPKKKSYSICFSCKKAFCFECLSEGYQHYYCSDPNCQEKLQLELDYKHNPRFCPKCIDETEETSTGDISSVNFSGQNFLGKEDICPLCSSFSTALKNTAFGIPFGLKLKYRVIEINKTETLSGIKQQFLSRKLKT